MKRLQDDGVDVHLSVHGANLELQPDDFRRPNSRSCSTATQGTVSFEGEFDHDDLPALMADTDWVVVPSVWWENSPLVIQEARKHRRPVIASDIGGMAEKVTDGVYGLHFRVDDPRSLAETIKRAVSTPSLWEELRTGIPQIYPMAEHTAALSNTYTELMEARRAATPEPQLLVTG